MVSGAKRQNKQERSRVRQDIKKFLLLEEVEREFEILDDMYEEAFKCYHEGPCEACQEVTENPGLSMDTTYLPTTVHGRS